MKEFLLTVKGSAPLSLWALSIVGVPLLMIAFSVVVPALRNPVFLMVGAFLGFLLPGSWVGGSRFSRLALVAGLILAAVYFGLVLILLQT